MNKRQGGEVEKDRKERKKLRKADKKQITHKIYTPFDLFSNVR